MTTSRTRQATEWIYEGVWGVLAAWFKVPRDPPDLPTELGQEVASFRPAAGFLSYLTLQFWIWLAIFDGVILLAWTILFFFWPPAGVVMLVPALVVAIVPDVLVYVAIHLRYDTTWYVLSDRSLRIRRGIWTIHETTITYENIQNVTVDQGPLQRWFGIADVVVDTAGGGGMIAGPHGAVPAGGHHGLIEGVADAERIRNLILGRLRHSVGAGLGDDVPTKNAASANWQSAHLAALKEIRAAARALAGVSR
jgi:membrane protein YdbS with pleckstrin-like domain